MMPQRYPKLTCDALSDINSNASQQSEFTTSFFLFTILAPSLPVTSRVVCKIDYGVQTPILIQVMEYGKDYSL